MILNGGDRPYVFCRSESCAIIRAVDIKYLLLNILRLYMLILFIWIITSWFPQARNYSFIRFLGDLSEPYLNFFRKIIPPIGGMLDISPMLALFLLMLLQRIIERLPI